MEGYNNPSSEKDQYYFKALEPYPISTEIIPKTSYHATFIVDEYEPD